MSRRSAGMEPITSQQRLYLLYILEAAVRPAAMGEDGDEEIQIYFLRRLILQKVAAQTWGSLMAR